MSDENKQTPEPPSPEVMPTIPFWHEAMIAFDRLGIRSTGDPIRIIQDACEAYHIRRLSELKPEEIQNLCHNLPTTVPLEEFARGCEAYQKKLYGKCQNEVHVEYALIEYAKERIAHQISEVDRKKWKACYEELEEVHRLERDKRRSDAESAQYTIQRLTDRLAEKDEIIEVLKLIEQMFGCEHVKHGVDNAQNIALHVTELMNAGEALWAVVANASGGDWSKESNQWRIAAAQARDDYFKAVGKNDLYKEAAATDKSGGVQNSV